MGRGERGKVKEAAITLAKYSKRKKGKVPLAKGGTAQIIDWLGGMSFY